MKRITKLSYPFFFSFYIKQKLRPVPKLQDEPSKYILKLSDHVDTK